MSCFKIFSQWCCKLATNNVSTLLFYIYLFTHLSSIDVASSCQSAAASSCISRSARPVIADISQHRQQWWWCTFLPSVYFLAKRIWNFGLFWPILANLLQIYELVGVFLQAYVNAVVYQIDKYQICTQYHCHSIIWRCKKIQNSKLSRNIVIFSKKYMRPFQ